MTRYRHFFQIQSAVARLGTALVQVMPDDHSNSVPPLPIPNRTVKRDYADDSAATSVKVGYRQASYLRNLRRNVEVFFRSAPPMGALLWVQVPPQGLIQCSMLRACASGRGLAVRPFPVADRQWR